MENGYNIAWSDQALHNLDEIILYLEKEWSDKEIRAFISWKRCSTLFP